MTEVIERVTVQADWMTVPRIVFRRFGRPVPGLVERVYDMNPGLADLGPYPPAGTAFLMPVTQEAGGPQGGAQTLEPIRLW